MISYPALVKAVMYCLSNGVPFPADLVADLEVEGINIKGAWDYTNELQRLTAQYIQDMRQPGGWGGGGFVDDFGRAIARYLTEAWNAGLRENDVKPEDAPEEWGEILDGIIVEEWSHIPDFAAWLLDIAQTAETIGDAINQANGRLEMWLGRYQDVYNQAVLLSADEKTKLEWIYGDTQHCDTCLALNGIVAYAREWDDSGFRPQQPPNGTLQCGGWHCQCQLIPTSKRRTRNAYDRLMSIQIS